jgi:hypothetical protein
MSLLSLFRRAKTPVFVREWKCGSVPCDESPEEQFAAAQLVTCDKGTGPLKNVLVHLSHDQAMVEVWVRPHFAEGMMVRLTPGKPEWRWTDDPGRDLSSAWDDNFEYNSLATSLLSKIETLFECSEPTRGYVLRQNMEGAPSPS